MIIEEDYKLRDKNRPIHLLSEFSGCVYPEKKTGNPKVDDLPVKGDDHGIDCALYMVGKLDGMDQGALPDTPTTNVDVGQPTGLLA